MTIAALAPVLIVGCSRGPGAGSRPERPHAGGTVYLLTESTGFTHLDPQLNYTTVALNVARLVYRTLTAFQSTPQHPGGVLRPDLATDLGRPGDGNRTWTFTLRSGAAWEDGRPVTCAEVKYGVERSFSADLRGGPAYPRVLLADTDGYRGPGVEGDNHGRGLNSVTCLSRRTIRFRLNQPCGDFADVVAMPVFAPVRPDVDARGDYDARPMSDGPYRITARDDQHLVLDRNRYWRRAADPVRPAYPDRYVVRFGVDPVYSTNSLVDDRGEARASIQLDYNVPPNFVQQVINDPVLSGRTVAGPTGAVRYLAINTRTVPDVRCRRALSFGLDKEAYRMVVGGAVVGAYATTMIPPGMSSHRSFDLYEGRRMPEGDVRRAARLVEAAGGCPAELTLDYQDVASYRRAAQSIVDSYQRIGIRVVPHPIPKSGFYDVVGDPRAQHDLVLAAWVPDWPNGSSIIPALFDGQLLRAHDTGGNYNFSLLADRRIDAMITTAQVESDRSQQFALWGAIDRAVSQRAATVPILYEKGLAMYGGNVRGALMQSLYGEPDVLSLWLA
ncbi:MAG: ABC transporter substrate-binding protein [Actinocatenispora sp.]